MTQQYVVPIIADPIIGKRYREFRVHRWDFEWVYFDVIERNERWTTVREFGEHKRIKTRLFDELVANGTYSEISERVFNRDQAR